MMYKHLFYIFIGLALFVSCKSAEPVTANVEPPALSRMKSMKLEAAIVKNQPLKQIPSASGMEYVEGNYYVLGDDSPYLYQLDAQYKPVKQYTLFDSSGFKNGRIPKSDKPDLESMAHFTYGRDNILLLLGSGASTARNKGYLVNLSDKMQVQEVDFTRFYTFLKRILGSKEEGELNIEGLAMDKTYAYLLHRPFTGTNILFRVDANSFKDFLIRGGDLPAVAVYYFTLPAIGQSFAGFSGAYTLEDKLFITASVEDTSNAIDDGEVLGSFVGAIDLLAFPYASDPANPLQVPTVQLKNSDGSVFKGKAESLVVTAVDQGKKYKAVVVTDDDQGGSDLLEVELVVHQDH
ncbi:DUF6929 family protein [Pontibacter sp. H249]|uniref:DUF6929 family protein n=1 Tax=Pontibacter sp. H249 TaxID=3133420 RepID=UPI0030BFDEC9